VGPRGKSEVREVRERSEGSELWAFFLLVVAQGGSGPFSGLSKWHVPPSTKTGLATGAWENRREKRDEQAAAAGVASHRRACPLRVGLDGKLFDLRTCDTHTNN